MAHDSQRPALGQQAGRIDDRRAESGCLVIEADLSAVEVDLDAVAQHPLGFLCGASRCFSGEVGRRDGERARLREQLEGDPVVRHPQGDGAPGLAEIPVEGRVRRQDHGESPWPERGDESANFRRHRLSEGIEGRDARNQHRRRRLPSATFGVEQSLHPVGVERVDREAVHRVGRQDNEFPPAECDPCESHASEKLVLVRAVVDGRHIARYLTSTAPARPAMYPSPRGLRQLCDR